MKPDCKLWESRPETVHQKDVVDTETASAKTAWLQELLENACGLPARFCWKLLDSSKPAIWQKNEFQLESPHMKV